MTKVVIGTDVQWYVGDELIDFGEPVFIGLDLASGPDMSWPPIAPDDFFMKPSIAPVARHHEQSHPVTARQLRRMERRRRRR